MKIDSYREKFIHISEEEVEKITNFAKNDIKAYGSNNRYYNAFKFVDMTSETDRMINRKVVMVICQPCLNPNEKDSIKKYGIKECFLNPKFIYLLEAVKNEKI